MSKKFNFELELHEAVELAALLSSCAELAQENILLDIYRANFIFRMTKLLREQITEKVSIEDIETAIEICRNEDSDADSLPQ